MDFIELSNEGFNEGLVENYITQILLLRFFKNLRFEKQVTFLTNLIFEVFAHQICQKCSNFQLNISWHSSHHAIIKIQMLLYLTVELFLFTFNMFLRIPHKLRIFICRMFISLCHWLTTLPIFRAKN